MGVFNHLFTVSRNWIPDSEKMAFGNNLVLDGNIRGGNEQKTALGRFQAARQPGHLFIFLILRETVCVT